MMTPKHQNFRPPAFLKHPMLQTVLASLPLRARGFHPMEAAAGKVVLTTAGGVRLMGMHSRRLRAGGRGLVILIHGWEGSCDSRYVKSAGRHLFERGFDIFRLNLRDHGPTHRLNPGLFWASNLDEVFDAVARAARLAGTGPAFLAGFSLGGNFALRIAAACVDKPIANLRHVVAVSPALDPAKATDRIDAHPMILGYFLKKWRRSLKAKAALYPGTYDFTRILALDNIRDMTAAAIEDYGAHPSIEAYFRDYTIADDIYGRIRMPATVITAADDPIIAAEDFYALPPNPVVRLIIHPRGGHNGFIENLWLNAWHERFMAGLFGISPQGGSRFQRQNL